MFVMEYEVSTFSPTLFMKILDLHCSYICVCVCVYLNSLRPLREVVNPTCRLSQKKQKKKKKVCVLMNSRVRGLEKSYLRV